MVFASVRYRQTRRERYSLLSAPLMRGLTIQQHCPWPSQTHLVAFGLPGAGVTEMPAAVEVVLTLNHRSLAIWLDSACWSPARSSGPPLEDSTGQTTDESPLVP